MNSTKELKILNQIEAICINSDKELTKVKYFVWGSRVIGWLTIFSAVLLFKQNQITPLVGLIVAALGGIAVGLAIYGRMALFQWPVLKAHIDINSVKDRIDEIKT